MAFDRAAVRERSAFSIKATEIQSSVCSSRPSSSEQCLYRRGITVVASYARGDSGSLPIPGPTGITAEIAKTIRVIMAKALSAMRIRACRRPAGANTLTEERTLRLSPLGNSATRSAAIVVGIPIVPSSGSASINAVNRTTAASLGISARLFASCQGSTSSRASAERTLSPVPFRSAPIGAQRNSLNSGPMRSARAGWVTAIPDPFLLAQRRGRRATPLKAPSELLDPGPTRGRAFVGGPYPGPPTNRSVRCPSRRYTGQNCC